MIKLLIGGVNRELGASRSGGNGFHTDRRFRASCSFVKMHSVEARRRGFLATAAHHGPNPRSTHIATTGYMFYIIFGATPGLHIA